MEIIKSINRIIAAPLVFLIWVYQKTVSPDHSPLKLMFPHGYCKFYPSCSEYAKEIYKTEGITGTLKVAKRVVSCNPWSQGGIDLPHKTYKQ